MYLSNKNIILESPEMSEDCLRITLYIPVSLNANEEYSNMSVIVHIHGGSNMVGGSSLFDGSILASRGQVIVAIINYRLSYLLFLNFFKFNRIKIFSFNLKHSRIFIW
jgi:para-nitrobenzyl esterase